MNLLVVGVSHHTAPVELLERLAVAPEASAPMVAEIARQAHINEAVLLSTCNRVEIYAAVTAFHGALTEVGGVLATRADLELAELVPHLYVHYDTEAVRHCLRVAAGLDSMVVGEAQILGQLRDAYALAAEAETTGRLLHELMQQALRVGKRVHTETGIDRAGQSVVSAALALAPDGVAGRSALVIGAGSMGGLALATLARAGASRLLVANRGADRAERLAALHGAVAVDFAELASALASVDVVVCATASPYPVLVEDDVSRALAGRETAAELVIIDLAVPRDVASGVADLAGVTVIDLGTMGATKLAEPPGTDQHAAETIVAAELEAFLIWLRGSNVAPTVAALRARADEVVEAELRRLAQRRTDLTDEQRAEVAQTVHRVVQQLLHSPSVRVRELATTPGGDHYVAALRELFDLSVPDPETNLGRAVAVEARGSGSATGEEPS
ncbi:MAG TPA: glutamyl-tRNA reductase [Micromonosporaceae bacterium]